MKRELYVLSTLALVFGVGSPVVRSQAPNAQPAAPKFHHLHYNSTNPAAAIAGYLKIFPTSTEKATLAGFDGIKNGNLYLLFSKVNTPAPAEPPSAFWHQVWLTPDVRQWVGRIRSANLEMMPLFTSDEGGSVDVSTDTLPGTLTRSALAEAKQKGVQPTHTAGFAFAKVTEGAVVEGFERAGQERLGQIDMWQDNPICATYWYEKHLNAAVGGRGFGATRPPEADCKTARGPEPSWPSTVKQGTFRAPGGRAMFGDVTLFWYMAQGDRPLAPRVGNSWIILRWPSAISTDGSRGSNART